MWRLREASSGYQTPISSNGAVYPTRGYVTELHINRGSIAGREESAGLAPH